MREELIKLLQDRVGLDHQKAETAADVVLNYLKERGPEELKSLLGGQGNLGNIGDIGGLFGKKQ